MPASFRREIPRSVPIVAVTRGGRVESVHRGSVAVVAEDGTLLASAGDPRQGVWLRSAAMDVIRPEATASKPFDSAVSAYFTSTPSTRGRIEPITTLQRSTA